MCVYCKKEVTKETQAPGMIVEAHHQCVLKRRAEELWTKNESLKRKR